MARAVLVFVVTGCAWCVLALWLVRAVVLVLGRLG